MSFVKSNYYRLKTKVMHKLTDDRYVFKMVDADKLDHRKLEGEVAHHFKQIDEIPEAILRTLPQTRAEISNLFDMGLRVVVVMVGDAFGCLGWVRLVKDFDWIVPLSPNDRIINRGYTNPAMRGRGLYGRCNAVTLEEDFDGQAEGGQVYCDCHIFNDASIRQFLRKGAFKTVARVRPLTPKALGKINSAAGAPQT